MAASKGTLRVKRSIVDILRDISKLGHDSASQRQKDSLTRDEIFGIFADLESEDLRKRKDAIHKIGCACDLMPWRGGVPSYLLHKRRDLTKEILLREMRGLKEEIFNFLRDTCPIYAEGSKLISKLSSKLVINEIHGRCLCSMCSGLTRTTHLSSTIERNVNRCHFDIDRRAMNLPPPCGGKCYEHGFHATAVGNAELILNGDCKVNVGRIATNTPSSLTTRNRSNRTFFARVPSFTEAYAKDGLRCDSTGKTWRVCFRVAAPQGEVESWTLTRQDFTLDTTYAQGVNAQNVQRTYEGDLDVLEVILLCPPDLS